mmetsp:Transcript_59585/g.123584  ORF Transcript_59585/g.123584 Transcript_59585/m.123584 type:complete len:80 (-) Transcript_59585:320-559(-)
MADESDQRIPQATSPSKINGQVDEVIPAMESRPVEQVEHISAGILLWHVSEHDSHPISIFDDFTLVGWAGFTNKRIISR